MAYRRRYLSGQSATTVVIAEGAITTDKIVDKAVTQPKVADDAVTTDKIAPGAVESSDIKDGEVKTADLGNGAVTTDKIADQAVTVDKLEASIQGIARPLTPGVSSAEIAAGAVIASKIAANAVETAKIKNGNVTADKLAADAVETVKVKDGAITTGKIAGGAIDTTKIAVGAVGNTDIANLAVSVEKLADNAVETVKVKGLNITTAKLADQAVETDKIKHLAVTAEKLGLEAVTDPRLNVAALASRHNSSFRSRVVEHFEEFGGAGISNKWRKVCDAGGLFFQDLQEGLQIRTGAVTGDRARIDFNGERSFHLNLGLYSADFYISTRGGAVNRFTQNCGFYFNADNHIVFYAHDNAGATPNWFAKCIVGGVPTAVDTGIAVTTAPQLLAIKCVATDSIEFYIDGVKEATITTNIPAVTYLDPWFEIITNENAIKLFKMTYVSILQDRPPYV